MVSAVRRMISAKVHTAMNFACLATPLHTILQLIYAPRFNAAKISSVQLINAKTEFALRKQSIVSKTQVTMNINLTGAMRQTVKKMVIAFLDIATCILQNALQFEYMKAPQVTLLAQLVNLSLSSEFQSVVFQFQSAQFSYASGNTSDKGYIGKRAQSTTQRCQAQRHLTKDRVHNKTKKVPKFR
ncbi:hypothetical protein FGO68_gene13883 [Halteria grandinella]|uniref:Uncharacterized protein n=1 Tax=Halteria grandinella TaxID=5974 RepID=A0A8J8T6J4_HALGN|nr:hypothetical protein FGO68_gene13883 [Halteria grandinella]